MNLYLVTLVQTIMGKESSQGSVYVVASDEAEASIKAMQEIKMRDWKWDDYVKSVELIASTEFGQASYLLISEAR